MTHSIYNHLLFQADLYDSQGLYEVCEQKLLEAEKIDPNEPIIQLALAEFYASIGRFAEAIYKFEQILPQAEGNRKYLILIND